MFIIPQLSILSIARKRDADGLSIILSIARKHDADDLNIILSIARKGGAGDSGIIPFKSQYPGAI